MKTTIPSDHRCKKKHPTGPTDCPTIRGYSGGMLNGAISDLSYSVRLGRAGQWERDRLAALMVERQRRDVGKEGK